MFKAASQNKRYGVEEPKVPALSKPNSLMARITGRRALSDITNTNTEGVGRETGKKAKSMASAPQFVAEPNSARTEINTARSEISTRGIVMEDVEEHRPYMNRPAEDIDAKDLRNPQQCTVFVNEMYAQFLQQEKTLMVSPSYISSQPYINDKMRTILVDWMVEVHLKFKMVPETLYLAVNILDRFLSKKKISRSRLQLVGVSSLLAASKYEEIYPPDLRELIYITEKAYNKREILGMESEILETLNFDLTVPTVHTFLCRHLKAAHADRAMVQMSCFLAERSLQEVTMARFPPSVISATAVYICRKTYERNPWSPTLLKYTTLDERDLAGCVEEMRSYMKNAKTSQQQAVMKKYSSTKFGSVSKKTLVM